MNKYLSDKIRSISFMLMIMVVYIHADNLKTDYYLRSGSIIERINVFIQTIISQGIARIAVPLFFAISGYLFFRNINKGALNVFFVKFKKRSRTLCVPYLLWSLYGIVLYFILQSLPFSRGFFTKELIRDFSTGQLFRTIFIDPIPYQLWFIRDLIVLVILSPILYRMIKYFSVFVFLVFLLAWLYGFNYVIFSGEALLFFTFGALLGIKGVNVQKYILPNNTLIFILIFWVIILVGKTILINIQYGDEFFIWILHKISVLVGVGSVWFLYDLVFSRSDVSNTRFYRLFQYTFFLYVFHEPLLTIIKKALFYLLGRSELMSLLIYFIAPTITIYVCIIVAKHLKRHTPGFYYLLTGGR